MITKLLNKVNENIETLNNLVQDKEYFEKLDERIEKANNYIQKQKQEIERLNNIIKEAIEFIYENAYDEKRKYCIDDLWDEIPKLLEILNKGE